MTDRWTDRLSEYLDGGLAPAEREALAGHLEACAACRATLAELGEVAARARTLPDRPPARDLWAGIAARIGAAGPVRDIRTARARRRWSFTAPQLAAAAGLLVLVSAGGAWLALRRGAPAPAAGVAAVAAAPVRAARWTERTVPTVDDAVGELRAALDSGSARLDPKTVQVLAQSLAVIDTAIAQARRALAADPGNAYLNRHLADTMRRKVELLRRVSVLAAARS